MTWRRTCATKVNGDSLVVVHEKTRVQPSGFLAKKILHRRLHSFDAP